MYFGSRKVNPTLVLEQEGQSEQLQVVRVDKGIHLHRGYRNTASCVFKNEIYAFKVGNYQEVHRYSLESGKWSRFYSQE